MSDRSAARRAPSKVSGGLPLLGHAVEFGRNSVALMQRVHRECGELGEFRLLNKKIVLMTGPAAHEAFCRAPDEQLSQKEAYEIMTPVFGPGVVFDAPLDRLREQLGFLMPALRDRNMRSYTSVFVEEVNGMMYGGNNGGNNGDGHGKPGLDAEGELDLLAFFAELTTYTSSHCLLGRKFRHEMNEEFARVYADLEGGVTPIGYINPWIPTPAHRRRDRARVRLVEMITDIIDDRSVTGDSADDALQVLIEARYSDGSSLTADEITGILTSAMFAGHHTSSGTLTWLVVELLRNPSVLARVLAENDEIMAASDDLGYQSLREMPELENALREVLRLHPPLVILLRGVIHDFDYGGYTVPAGSQVAISPVVAGLLEESFPGPLSFDPSRYLPGREEHEKPFAWIPFGGGRHRCAGSAFAFMQIKAIMTSLLANFEFRLVDAPDSYKADYTKMVVQPAGPVRVRYRRRGQGIRPTRTSSDTGSTRAGVAADVQPTGPLRVSVDLDLCQGHGVCESEAPEVFRVDTASNKVVLLDPQPPDNQRQGVAAAAANCPTRAIRTADSNKKTASDPLP